MNTPEAVAVCSESTSKSSQLIGAASQIDDVIQHLEQLKNQIGIYSEPVELPKEMPKQKNDSTLVHVLNYLSGDIIEKCSKAHTLIDELQSNLL